ncbi:MAG: hypothetical protein LBT77_01000 [Mycoplasmataceae bacterium]|nr:hypothetical protein [Mycoplasmataceae bacterium]
MVKQKKITHIKFVNLIWETKDSGSVGIIKDVKSPTDNKKRRGNNEPPIWFQMWFQDFAKNLDKRFDKQEEFNKEIKISLEKINIKVNNLSSRVNKLVKINNLKE